jgi:hypothetical protein
MGKKNEEKDEGACVQALFYFLMKELVSSSFMAFGKTVKNFVPAHYLLIFTRLIFFAKRSVSLFCKTNVLWRQTNLLKKLRRI